MSYCTRVKHSHVLVRHYIKTCAAILFITALLKLFFALATAGSSAWLAAITASPEWAYRVTGRLTYSDTLAGGRQSSVPFEVTVRGNSWSVRLNGNASTGSGRVPASQIVRAEYIQMSSENDRLYYYYCPQETRRGDGAVARPPGFAEKWEGAYPRAVGHRALIALWYAFASSPYFAQHGVTNDIPALEPGGRSLVKAKVALSRNPPYLPISIQSSNYVGPETLGNSVEVHFRAVAMAQFGDLSLPKAVAVEYLHPQMSDLPIMTIRINADFFHKPETRPVFVPVLKGDTYLQDHTYTEKASVARVLVLTNKWPSEQTLAALGIERIKREQTSISSNIWMTAALLAVLLAGGLCLIRAMRSHSNE